MMEIVGILAGIIVAVSYGFSGTRLRIVGTVGSVFFVIYGILIHSYPVALLNAFVVCINIYKIISKKK